MAMKHRPIDVLNQARGKNIVVKLKNKTMVSGTVEAFDLHMNVWLRNVVVTREDGTEENHDEMLVRGDMVVFISPA